MKRIDQRCAVPISSKTLGNFVAALDTLFQESYVSYTWALFMLTKSTKSSLLCGSVIICRYSHVFRVVFFATSSFHVQVPCIVRCFFVSFFFETPCASGTYSLCPPPRCKGTHTYQCSFFTCTCGRAFFFCAALFSRGSCRVHFLRD